ncbi:MAG TPA: phosphomannomutase/phosphoglucomutase [Gammaproteobacteria bacterium]|nr:phosphomannomutase/phosphoglucomutase [Gammaproteobacteria bacterium]
MTELAADIFKAYDIRGVVDKTLTEKAIRDIGHVLGSIAHEQDIHSIVVGRDGRLSGPRLQAVLMEGIAASGCNVIDIGMVPTPVVYFAAQYFGSGSGLALTGSHNPPDYNGIKMMIGGETLAAEAIQTIRQRILERNLHHGEGKIRRESVIERYMTRITDDVKMTRLMRIVMDCGNGVAGAVAPQLFRRLGCEVTELFSEVDGHFPNHHPDPSQPENLQDLIAKVQSCGAELGIAFDGDGDRLGVVTPDGTIIWSDRQMMLFARDVLERQPGAEIIYDVKCSQQLPNVIHDAGGKATMSRTGHSFIKKALRESGAALAGEMSGHIFFSERWYGFDDGLYAGCRLMELLSRANSVPQEVFASLPNTINTPELRIHFADGDHHAFMDRLAAAADFPAGKVSLIDGIRVDFEDGFGLVRASNTTPILVLRFEASTEQGLETIMQQFRALLSGVDPELPLPF